MHGARILVAFGLLLALAAPTVFIQATAEPPKGATAKAPSAVLEPVATYPLFDPFNYSDVILLGNNNSAVSRNLTTHFQQARNVPAENVFFADLPDTETISPAQWSAFASGFTGEMANRSLGALINYIVTFKGMPIRVSWATPGGPTSFQDALMLLGGSYESYIGNANLYSNPYFNRTERFTFREFGIRLVTGIYAYNESTAMALIDRAGASLGSRGEFVFDADSSKGFAGGWGGYGYANAALVWANASLSASGLPVFLDTNTTYLTGRTNVIGYSSWGSNDCCWGSVTQLALPHNTWINGSIGETFVSTGARTFTWPPSYGQSLIADWIDEGATGMKGYTDEPYISAIADGHILFPRYVAGYGLAESYWSASHVLGWRQIVIGDPKMAPYADVTDLGVNTTLTAVPGAAEQFGALNLTLGLGNTGALDTEVTVSLNLSDMELGRLTLHVPAVSAATYSVNMSLSLVPSSTWGVQNVTVTVDPDGLVRERDEGNNIYLALTELLRKPLASVSGPASILTYDTALFLLSTLRADRPIDHFEVSLDAAPAENVAASAGAATYSASYARAGTHYVNVTAVDSLAIRSDPFGPLVLVVLNRPPQAVLEAGDLNPLTLVAITFSAANSTDMDGSVASYGWDAGPLGTGADVNFTVAFLRAGVYVLKLTVWDDLGFVGTASVDVAVRNRLPVAMIRSNVSQTLTMLPVNFSAVDSLDPDGVIVSYDFQFDDGTRITLPGPFATHTFSRPGTFGLWLEVTDDEGAKSRARHFVEFVNRPPGAAWQGSPPFTASESTLFSARVDAADLDGNLTSYAVTFGDGRRGAGLLVGGATAPILLSHVYESEGDYTISVTVVDEWGANTTAVALVQVSHPAPLFVDKQVAVLGTNVSVDYTVDSPYLELALVVYVDGAMWRNFAIDASGTSVVRLGGLEPGNYTVRIEITDGVKSAELGSVFVIVPGPVAAQPPPGPTAPQEAPMGSLALVAAGVGGALAIGYLLLRRRAKVAHGGASENEQALER